MAQLRSFSMLVRLCSKSFKLALASVRQELPAVQARFRKRRGTRDQIANITGSQRKQGNSRKISTSASLTTRKSLTMWNTLNCGRVLREMRIPNHLTGLLRNLYASFLLAYWTEYGKTGWFKIGKGVHQSCILLPCLFICSISCKMPGWMTNKLLSRLPGEMSTTSDMQMTPL